jgi:hypothetical protein
MNARCVRTTTDLTTDEDMIQASKRRRLNIKTRCTDSVFEPSGGASLRDGAASNPVMEKPFGTNMPSMFAKVGNAPSRSSASNPGGISYGSPMAIFW